MKSDNQLMKKVFIHNEYNEFVEKARLNKLLTVKASDNVVRLLPPLILESKECKEALGKIKATCEMY